METPQEIRDLLARLDGAPADRLESETLEFKSWNERSEAREAQLRELRETVVCLANHRGGTIVLGVADRKRTRRDAIHGVENVDVLDLRRKIYDGTEPSILVEIDEMVEAEGRLLLVRVPRGMPPHTTSEGVGKIRMGKECKPLTGSLLTRLIVRGGQRDLSAEILPEATLEDLDPTQIESLRRALRTEARHEELARLPDPEMLQNLGLIAGEDVTFAAVLLLGRATAIARWAPQQEVVFLRFRSRTSYDLRRDLKGPLLAILEQLRQLLEAHLGLVQVASEGFVQLEIPDLSWWAAREAVLNALIHRDFFLRQSVQVELHPSRLEISSPGGFVGGVTPSNILRHPPVRRNPLLAEVLQTLGYVNRAGLGVDRLYEELLRLGKAPPHFRADEAHVHLTLDLRTHGRFAAFVSDEARSGRRLELDDLILFRGVVDRGHLTRFDAAGLLQSNDAEASERLVSLRKSGYLAARGRGRGTSYILPRRLSDALRGPGETDRDLALDGSAVLLRTQQVLLERGRITNAEVRRLAGYSRNEALELLQEMKKEGLVDLLGRGRGAYYVPTPRLHEMVDRKRPRK